MTLKVVKQLALALTLSISGFISTATAGLIFQPDYYTYYEVGNGLEWVYASPCATDINPSGSCSSPLSLIDGFRFASLTEWNASFSSLQDLITAFDTQNGASDALICAAPYFGGTYSYCDEGDVSAGYVSGAPIAWAPQSGSSIAETFLVRGQLSQPPRDVPEPSSLAIFALGILAFAARRFKR
ncbi:PEP-CTERM sorting domain-containing protein [Thalassotalea sp. PLHSN55]|uniref:PEP-CTERM sorting domain-containing protein n=1 Tax=Thalassotalea sp. PLHSN55 TaxID=3435888 RepID=UPI003F87E98A